MAQAMEGLQDNRKRQADLSAEEEELEVDQGEWQVVAAKKKKKQVQAPQVPQASGPRRSRFNCFKVLASNSTEAYRKVALLNEKNPNLSEHDCKAKLEK